MAAGELGLIGGINFKSITAPWERQMNELCAELADELADNDDAASDLRSFRFSTAELQQLRCPANSDPAMKLKYFHLEIVALKDMCNTEVQVLLQQGMCP